MKLAIVVPTIRQASLDRFKEAWRPQIEKHRASLVVVHDGEVPTLTSYERGDFGEPYRVLEQKSALDVMGKELDLIYCLNDGVRNLGFAYVAHSLDVDAIVTLDDDVLPEGDTLGDHIGALNRQVPISWFSTASRYMRGFPYEVRNEATVWVSHGVWKGVADYDAATQLVNGNQPVDFYQGPVPKGALTPVCGMNLAFRREALRYVYFAPMGRRTPYHRFADIWMGIHLKQALDKLNRAMVSGYAVVKHERASDPFNNLIQEGPGLQANESYWKGVLACAPGSYFDTYTKLRARWEAYVSQ